MFDFSIVTQWFDGLLRNTLGLGDFWAILIECVLVGVLILVGYALLAIVLIFMERKVCAYFQCRLGPMRVGPWGIFQVFADVVKMLSEKGRISIDAQGYLREVRGENVFPTDWHDKLSILSLCDILKVNEQEMLAITGRHDAREAARQLAEWGVKEVLVTLGSEGSIILSKGQFYDIPAYKPRRIADATGCGDTYSAGYLYCRSLGEGFAEAGRFAAAMCTLKLEHSGPFDRTVEEVKTIVKSK